MFAADDGFFEPGCKIRKQEDGSEQDYAREVDSPFSIVSGNAAKLFNTIDKALNQIMLAKSFSKKALCVSLFFVPRNGYQTYINPSARECLLVPAHVFLISISRLAKEEQLNRDE